MFDDLLAVVRPPAHPVDPPAPSDWAAAAVELGIPGWPADLVAVVTACGSGWVGGHLVLDNPAVGLPVEVQTMNLEGLGLPLWHEPNGLLPVGSTVDGDTLCLRVVGEDPDRWPVVFLGDGLEVVDTGTSLSELLVAWLSGEQTVLRPDAAGRPFLQQTPVWVPPVEPPSSAPDVPGLAELLALVPPPAAPVEVPGEGAWAHALELLGLPVRPPDVAAYLARYGTVWLDGSIGVLNPAAARSDRDLGVGGAGRLRSWTEAAADDEQYRPPVPFHPAPGGLVPVATLDDGVHAASLWHRVPTSADDPLAWQVLSRTSDGWRDHGLRLVPFLVAWLRGEVQLGDRS